MINYFVISAISIAIGIITVLADLDRAHRWLGWALSYFTWISRRILRRKISAELEGKANQYLHTRLFALPEGVESPRIKVKWVRDPKDPVFRDGGTVIVRLRDEDDSSRNILNAVASVLPSILVPRVRPYLEHDFVEAIDLHVLKQLARLVSTDAERIFATDFLGPRSRVRLDMQQTPASGGWIYGREQKLWVR